VNQQRRWGPPLGAQETGRASGDFGGTDQPLMSDEDKPVRVCADEVQAYVEKFGKEAAERYFAGCVMYDDDMPVAAFLAEA
jgi:hypothetical protein